MSARSRWAAGLVVLASTAFATSAAAENLGNGIVYDSANGYHTVVADLASIGTEVRVALPHYNGNQEDVPADAIRVQAHALEEGATVAINANYFGGYPSNYPCGMARGFGNEYLDAYEEAVNCVTTLGWTTATPANAASIFDSTGHAHDASFTPQFTDLTTGGGYLVSGGSAHDLNHAKLEVGRDCTAVGVSADRKHFVMVVTDDTVCSGPQLQQVLMAHGAADAIQLDGGGSSKMWIRGKGYVNNEPQDRSPSVAIVARPNGQCPSDCGNALCVQLSRPFRAQCVGQPCRAGLGALWNCDESKVRRVHCDNGVVVSEHCAQGCSPQPNGQDDVCVGGTVPEPGPDAGSDASAVDASGDDASAAVDSGGVQDDAGPPVNDAPASTESSGCGCRVARVTDGVAVGAWAAVGVVVIARRRRRL
jgi:MYXO-CTERM domain-containing protein